MLREREREREKKVGHLAKDFSLKTTGMWSNYRFLHLYRYLRKDKPSNLIEFGAGVSTIFMAEILRRNYEQWGVPGKLISLEQDEKFFTKYTAFFPEELKPYCSILLCPVKLEWFGQYRGIYYDFDNYPKEVDFVYVDGATRTRGCPACNFVYPRLNADIVRMNKMGIKFKIALTDHRYTNFPFYVKELGNNYNVSLNKLWRSIIISSKTQ